MRTNRSISSSAKGRLRFVIGLLVLLLASSTFAQNTKGDKPSSTPAATQQKKKLFKKKSSGPRIPAGGDRRSKSVKRADKISNAPLPSAPISKNPPSGRDRAYKRTISGGRITAPRSSSGRISRVYPQRGPYVNNPSPQPNKSGRDGSGKWPKGRTVTGQSAKPRSVSAKMSGKVYPQRSAFVHNPSAKPRRPDAKPRNKPLYQARQLSMSKAAAQARSMGIRGGGFKTITARFITAPKNNVYWGKVRKKREQAYTTDITGRKLRTRDQRSPKMGLVSTDTLPFARRSPREAKRGASQSLGGYSSATRTGRAWKGDIAGGRIKQNPNKGTSEKSGKFVWPRRLSVTAKAKRSDNLKSGQKFASSGSPKVSSKKLPVKAPGLGAVAYYGFSRRSSALKKTKGAGGSVTASLKKDRRPLPSKGVSSGAMRVSRFAGNFKSGRRPIKGGGSISRGGWNNNRNAVTLRKAGSGTIQAAQFKGRQRGIGGTAQFGRMGGGFTGYTKTRKPEKGGGSVSGSLWNNRNQPVAVREGGRGARMAGNFQGTSKTRQPLKGGGSISGKTWNNKSKPINVRTGGLGSIAAGNFQGNVKTRRPEKGGGSVSGKLWNNGSQPIAVREGARGGRAAGTFQGNIKTQRPEKGGGSVSGKLWNNKNQPIEVHTGGRGTRLAGMYQGNLKTKRPEKGGGSVSGKLWNNKNQPIEVHTGGKGTQLAGNFQGKTKYKKPLETAGAPSKFKGRIKGSIAGADITQIGLNYTGDRRIRDGNKIDNKQTSLLTRLRGKQNAALPTTHVKRDEQAANFKHRGKKVMVAGPEITQIGLNYTGDRKQVKYTKAPNSPKGALKVKEPGKAQPHIGDLQVNVKMKRHVGKELHPDARYAHIQHNNVKEERTLLMNFRLAWAKLFKKSDTQPRGLKQKNPKPRYDPAEEGIWYK